MWRNAGSRNAKVFPVPVWKRPWKVEHTIEGTFSLHRTVQREKLWVRVMHEIITGKNGKNWIIFAPIARWRHCRAGSKLAARLYKPGLFQSNPNQTRQWAMLDTGKKSTINSSKKNAALGGESDYKHLLGLNKNKNPTVAWPSGNLHFSFTCL